MSPPCPAWSKATTCPGISRHEGRLTLYAWALLNLIRPRVACMEMVGSMRGHEHWPLVKSMILWAGYSIRFAKVLNLAEISPQHRERLIVVATLDGEDHHPHLCTQWPPRTRRSVDRSNYDRQCHSQPILGSSTSSQECWGSWETIQEEPEGC